MSEEKTFLLGVGAQKAGTTWLHRYLDSFPETDLGELKEYHVWDALTVPAMEYFLLRPREEVSLRGGIRRVRQRLGLRKPSLQERMQRDPEAYFDYFAALLSRPGIRLTADITPSYTALSANTLQRISEGFASRGIETRVVLLLRDPADRCWSAARMYKGMGKKDLARDHGVDISLDDAAAVLDYSRSEQAWLRTDYPRTLQSLREVFPEERLFVGCYETFFSTGELERLGSFFGLKADASRLGVRVNASDARHSLDADLRRCLKGIYAEVYAHFAAKDTWIGDAWRAREQELYPDTTFSP